MSDFKSEFWQLLVDELGATEEEASRIAKKADRFREDTGQDDSPEKLIERMKKRSHAIPIQKWNNVVGFLNGGSYDLGGGDESQYKLDS